MKFFETSEYFQLNKPTYINLRWIAIIGQDPSILFNKNKHSIKLHFDMFHGYGKSDQAINVMKKKDREEFMIESGIKNTGLNNLIKTGYNTLGLSTFFTSGPEESRAWTIEKNSTAPKAAGEIHSDFEKGFIRVELARRLQMRRSR